MCTKQTKHKPVCRRVAGLMLLFIIQGYVLLAQNRTDSIRTLQKVTVTGEKNPNPFAAIVPVQVLNHEALQEINAESIAGAAKYFSGVLIKDYGGVGGLRDWSMME
jgi:vitamin B12 transporter